MSYAMQEGNTVQHAQLKTLPPCGKLNDKN